jgi:hypothetical protein
VFKDDAENEAFTVTVRKGDCEDDDDSVATAEDEDVDDSVRVAVGLTVPVGTLVSLGLDVPLIVEVATDVGVVELDGEWVPVTVAEELTEEVAADEIVRVIVDAGVFVAEPVKEPVTVDDNDADSQCEPETEDVPEVENDSDGVAEEVVIDDEVTAALAENDEVATEEVLAKLLGDATLDWELETVGEDVALTVAVRTEEAENELEAVALTDEDVTAEEEAEAVEVALVVGDTVVDRERVVVTLAVDVGQDVAEFVSENEPVEETVDECEVVTVAFRVPEMEPVDVTDDVLPAVTEAAADREYERREEEVAEEVTFAVEERDPLGL